MNSLAQSKKKTKLVRSAWNILKARKRRFKLFFGN